MTTPLPEPDINTASHINTRIVGYTADKVRQYAADETKRLAAKLQEMTAERDALKADAERYRWLFEKTLTTQPEVVRVLVMHRGQCVQKNGMHLDAAIDAAMKGKA